MGRDSKACVVGELSARQRRGAFTLIELLIVMMLIAILMGLLYPVLLKSRGWGREKQAMMEIKNLELAIKAYKNVYGKWPAQTKFGNDIYYTNDNQPVISNLLHNPRGLVFLQYQASSLSTNPADQGSYLDPWQRPYVILLDASGDQQIAELEINAEVGVFSWGPGGAVQLAKTNNIAQIELRSWNISYDKTQ